MTTRGLCELTPESRDHRALARFYQEPLRLPLLARRTIASGSRAGWRRTGFAPAARLRVPLSLRPGPAVAIGRSPSARPTSRWPSCWVASRPQQVGVEHHAPVEHPAGDQSLYFADPEGNVVETWDFFEEGDGAEDGVDALS
jgi:hypothetical protein